MIIRLVFRNAPTMLRHLVRFQEFYESPELKGEPFSLDELNEFYIKHKGGSLEKKYYNFWSGCNFPGYISECFRQGVMGPLSQKEHRVMSCLPDDIGYEYYVIASAPREKAIILHERGHALFYLDETYRRECCDIVTAIARLDGGRVYSSLEAELRKWGYADIVLVDETAAYLLDGSLMGMTKGAKQHTAELRALRKKLLRIFRQRVKLYKERVVYV